MSGPIIFGFFDTDYINKTFNGTYCNLPPPLDCSRQITCSNYTTEGGNFTQYLNLTTTTEDPFSGEDDDDDDDEDDDSWKERPGFGVCHTTMLDASCQPGYIWDWNYFPRRNFLTLPLDYNDVYDALLEYYAWLASEDGHQIILSNGRSLIYNDSFSLYREWVSRAAESDRFDCVDLVYPFTRAVCPGFYSPESFNCMERCKISGSFCPSSDTFNYTQAGDCGLLKSRLAEELGCGGAKNLYFECPPGSYCPTPDESFTCPAGSYCHSGSSEPKKCNFWQICPRGSAFPDASRILLAVCVIFFIFSSILLWRERFLKLCTPLITWLLKRYGDRLNDDDKKKILLIVSSNTMMYMDTKDNEEVNQNITRLGSLHRQGQSISVWGPQEMAQRLSIAAKKTGDGRRSFKPSMLLKETPDFFKKGTVESTVQHIESPVGSVKRRANRFHPETVSQETIVKPSHVKLQKSALDMLGDEELVEDGSGGSPPAVAAASSQPSTEQDDFDNQVTSLERGITAPDSHDMINEQKEPPSNSGGNANGGGLPPPVRSETSLMEEPQTTPVKITHSPAPSTTLTVNQQSHGRRPKHQTYFSGNQLMTPATADGAVDNSFVQMAEMASVDRYASHLGSMLDFDLEKNEIRRRTKSQQVKDIRTIATQLVKKKQKMTKEEIEMRKQLYQVDVSFKDLKLKIKGSGLVVLDNISGNIPAGGVTAIMGPSGAGKTSFLFTLSGKARAYGDIEGDIFINGEPGECRDIKDIVGFVPQNDIMCPHLTVRETFEYHANLRLPVSYTREEKADIVDDVIDLLGLTMIEDVVIGDEKKRGISGGQKKRVNIGMELVAEPMVLFLDEPTSGLDSTTSNEVMDVLKLIAEKRGTNVMVVLHQPRYEIYKRFDNVILLGVGGKAVYMGPTDLSIPYMENVTGMKVPNHTNPADFIMDVMTDFPHIDFPLAWKQVQEDPKYKFVDIVPQSQRGSDYVPRETPGWWTQTKLVLGRRWLAMYIRQARVVFANCLMVAVSGFVIAAIGEESAFGYISLNVFMLNLILVILTLMASLNDYGQDRLIYYREASSGLSREAYFTAQNINSFLSAMLLPFVFESFYYTVFQPRGLWVDYMTTSFMIWVAIQSVAQFITIMFEDSKVTIVGGAIGVIYNIASGHTPRLATMTNTVLGLIIMSCNPARWSLEALFLIESRGWNEVYKINRNSTCELQGWDCSGYNRDLIALAIFIVVVRGFILAALHFNNRAKQI